jgi:hypothetical protein
VRHNNIARPMSAWRQKRTSRRVNAMSALPPKSGHSSLQLGCPLCAKSCREQVQQVIRHSITSPAP